MMMKDDSEDNYAARVGRMMWRMARRRARQALAVGLPLAGGFKSDSSAGSPKEPLRQEPEDRSAGPRDLSEFLQELAEELEQDEPGPPKW